MLTSPTFRYALFVMARLLRKVIAYPKIAVHLLRSFLSRYQISTRSKAAANPRPEYYLSHSECFPLVEVGSGASTLPSTSPPSDASCAGDNTTSPSMVLQTTPLLSEPHPNNQSDGTDTTQVIDNGLSGGGQRPKKTYGWQLVPVTATEVMEQRYKRDHFAKEPTSPPKIYAGETTFVDDNESGWADYVHPEGSLYFLRKRPRDQRGTVLTIFTNADVRDPRRDIRTILDQGIDDILTQAIEDGLRDDAELVLCPDFKRKTIGYYFVYLQARCLVWVETLTTAEAHIIENVKGVRRNGHIRHAMESQYWAHIEAFPHDRTLEATMYRELTNVVLHASAERLTSLGSLSLYGADELEKISVILDSLKDQVEQESPYAVCIVARFSHAFAVSRLHNFCGQPEARLDADKSVWRDESNASHPIFSCLSLCMFLTPHAQLERLNTIWVDRTVNTARWKEYISTVCDEFTGLTLYSTVMLAVDVSFLAVPSVDVGPGNENTATVSTYLSIIAVVGSMTLSLLLSADARRRQSQSASSAAYLLGTVSSLVGLEFLAIMYSLPFTLLMWGMLTFLIGLCSRIFPHAEKYTFGLCIAALIIVAMAVCLPLLTWWCVKRLNAADD